MALWEYAVELLKAGMFVSSQVFGGNVGAGILTISLAVRLALMPLTLRLARAARRHRLQLDELRPELDRIKSRFEGDQRRIAMETQRVLSREGISLMPRGWVGSLAQTPFILALFAAARTVSAAGGRFLWIESIARPDIALALLVAGLTGAAVGAGAPPAAGSRTLLMLVPTTVTLIFLWKMAAGLGLYWGASSTVSLLQAVIVHRGGPASRHDG